jgi:hypothetical protein
LSFLRALYSSTGYLFANQQRGEIRDRLRQDLDRSASAEAARAD